METTRGQGQRRRGGALAEPSLPPAVHKPGGRARLACGRLDAAPTKLGMSLAAQLQTLLVQRIRNSYASLPTHTYTNHAGASWWTLVQNLRLSR